MECARTDWLRSLGEGHDAMTRLGLQCVVSELHTRYGQPARLLNPLGTP